MAIQINQPQSNSVYADALNRAAQQLQIKHGYAQELQNLLAQQGTFAQRLKDRSAQFDELNGIQTDRTKALMTGSDGGPRVDPQQVLANRQSFLSSGRDYVYQPYKQLLDLNNQISSAIERQANLDYKNRELDLRYSGEQGGLNPLIQPPEEQGKEGETSPDGNFVFEKGKWKSLQNLTDEDVTRMLLAEPGGKAFWDSLGGAAPERLRFMRGILENWGSLKNYFQKTKLTDLLSPTETKKRNETNDLITNALNILGLVTDENGNVINAEGVGPLGGFVPGVFNRGTTLKGDIALFTADKMKELSGATVSDNEVKRLSDALPSKFNTEAQIKEKVERIARVLKAGLKLSEIAKREQLTLDEAYEKYGIEVYTDMGIKVPKWMTKFYDSKDKVNKSGGNDYDDIINTVFK